MSEITKSPLKKRKIVTISNFVKFCGQTLPFHSEALSEFLGSNLFSKANETWGFISLFVTGCTCTTTFRQGQRALFTACYICTFLWSFQRENAEHRASQPELLVSFASKQRCSFSRNKDWPFASFWSQAFCKPSSWSYPAQQKPAKFWPSFSSATPAPAICQRHSPNRWKHRKQILSKLWFLTFGSYWKVPKLFMRDWTVYLLAAETEITNCQDNQRKTLEVRAFLSPPLYLRWLSCWSPLVSCVTDWLIVSVSQTVFAVHAQIAAVGSWSCPAFLQVTCAVFSCWNSCSVQKIEGAKRELEKAQEESKNAGDYLAGISADVHHISLEVAAKEVPPTRQDFLHTWLSLALLTSDIPTKLDTRLA